MALRCASRTVAVRVAVVARTKTLLPSTTSFVPAATTTRCFSEESSGIMGKIRDKWDDRSAKAQEKKYKEQMQKMASAEKWTLQDFNDELKETLGSWRSKIPGMSGMSQMKVAKQTQQMVEAVMDQVGPEATAEDLKNLGRQEKLKISLTSGSSLQDLNILVKQFQGMDIMQQVLRRRKLEGKPLPMDEASMKAAIQQDAGKVMSKTQKKHMMRARQQKRY